MQHASRHLTELLGYIYIILAQAKANADIKKMESEVDPYRESGLRTKKH